LESLIIPVIVLLQTAQKSTVIPNLIDTPIALNEEINQSLTIY